MARPWREIPRKRLRPRAPEVPVDVARWLPMPPGWEGDCSMWFERLPSFKGWAPLTPACRLHDWYYALLRANYGAWSDEEWGEFRAWADAVFRDALVQILGDYYRPAVACFIADRMHWAVRTSFGEAAARPQGD